MVPAAPNIINNHRASAARDAVWSSQTLLNSSRRCRLDFVKCSNLWGQQAGIRGTIALDTTRNTAGEKRWFLRLFPELPQVEASSRLNLVRSSEQRFLRMPRTQARANLSKWALINYANKLFIFTILNVKRIFDSIVSENLCCSGGGSLLLASYQLGSYNQAREGEWRRLC